MQDGKMGDQVRLKNLESGRILTGIVTGPNAASGL
jgi:flagella basal body P-ring formation protein FlgA